MNYPKKIDPWLIALVFGLICVIYLIVFRDMGTADQAVKVLVLAGAGTIALMLLLAWISRILRK